MDRASPLARPLPAPAAAAVGLAGLAAAMGIGRFAFTPLLPLMQTELGLPLAQGAWLASANYAGYLAGALASLALAPRAGPAARWGLVAVVLTTLGMAVPGGLLLWALLRFASGVASAFVLVGTSGWAMAQLAAAGRPALAGWVFGGVGAGIVLAGLVGLAAGTAAWPVADVWRALGVMAAVLCAATWPAFGRDAFPAAARAPAAGPVAPLGRSAAVLALCYGLFGLGYILPATFIPAAARAAMPDPAVFGWAWPLFGAAAFVSTVLATRWAGVPPRRLAARSLALMACGVVAPALWPGLPALLFSALAVGGTFMVATMASLQEARRLAPQAATRLMSAMSAAFALGQLIGPLLVGRPGASLAGASGVAAGALALAALALRVRFSE